MVDYNLTVILDVSNPLDVLGVFNLYSYNSFVVVMIILATILLTIWFIRENFGFAKAALLSLGSTLLPAVYFRTIDKLGSPLIGDWYIAVHIVLLAAFAMAVYFDKD